MKIVLIHPQNYLQRFETGIYGRSLRYAPLTMPTLKTLVPPELNANILIIDEMIEKLDFSIEADLVAITAITGTALRAYEIADSFRSRGIPVVLGGVHTSLLPEEAERHADAIVIGYAERTWPQLLKDFAFGKMKKRYSDDIPFRSDIIPVPDRSGIHKKDYLGYCTVEMGRGCTNECEFCISHRFHNRYIRRPVDIVINEIKTLKSKIIFFLDPNLNGDREHAKLFFQELTKLNKWWVGCASLDIVEDQELLKIMAKSGCKGLLMGFESIRTEALTASKKHNNIGKHYRDVVNEIHRHGIMVQACFVFGFDTDDTSVFEETANYIISGRFDLPQISIYTPFPGTPLFDKMKKDGRILTEDWSLYNGQNVVFQPTRMSVDELRQGTDMVRKKVHSLKALSKRIFIKPIMMKPFIALSYLGFRFYQDRIERTSSKIQIR